MKIILLASALLFVPSFPPLLAQGTAAGQAPASTGPLLVDVHPAPYRRSIVYHTNISSQRFDMRHATVFEMIQFAYDLGEQDDDRENAAIVGGPSWIDFDRFDITAKITPSKATALNAGAADGVNLPLDPDDQFRPILKRVLAERFHLKFHTESRPLPGFVVTVAKDGPKLAEAKEPGAPSECHGAQDKVDPTHFTLTCTSETMGQFIAARDQDFSHTIIDRTGLTKPYDFTLKLVLPPEVHTRDDRARVFTEAFAKQLGLAVTRGDVPQPAYIVDSVDHLTPNPPEIAKLIPTLPDLEFEVASIRPAADTDPESQIRYAGSQITFFSMQLSELIVRAWQLPTSQMLGDAISLLPKTRFTILVKLPLDSDARAISQDPDLLANMLQKLLIERFQIKAHWGEWTQPDAYVLLAGTPKMKKADPNSRTFCKYGPVEGEKPNRYLNSPYDVEFHCQNITMAQFANMVQTMATSDVKNRVPDKTGLDGSYDFTVFYTAGRTLRSRTVTAASEAKQAGDTTAAPVEGISVEDAFRKELGLRLEKQHVVLPALVLDHFSQVPTDN
jgi:uncharacterized protein (TIGR03435 family)